MGQGLEARRNGLESTGYRTWLSTRADCGERFLVLPEAPRSASYPQFLRFHRQQVFKGVSVR